MNQNPKINSGPFCFPRDECGEFPLPSDRWHHGGEQEPDQWECEHREAEPGGPGRQRESSQDWGQGPPAKGLPICKELIEQYPIFSLGPF